MKHLLFNIIVFLTISNVHQALSRSSDLESLENSTWSFQDLLSQGITFGQQGVSVSLSADGNTLAVGAPFIDTSEPGTSYIYARAGAIWDLQTALSQGVTNSTEGIAVSLSANGTILAAGASSFMNTGATQVYGKTNSEWEHVATLSQNIDSSYEGREVALLANATTSETNSTVYKIILASGAFRYNDYNGAVMVYLGTIVESNSTSHNTGCGIPCIIGATAGGIVGASLLIAGIILARAYCRTHSPERTPLMS